MGSHGVEAFSASPQRFQTLGLYWAISFLWAGSWICFAPLSDYAEARFEVGPGAVNTLASSFLFCYVPSSALCLYVVDRYGVRVCLAASVSVNTAVVFVRWLALALPLSPHAAYAVNLAAQLCAALCQAMAVNLPARVAGDWFPSHERDLATVAAAMSNVAGQMCFSLIPPLLVHNPAQLGLILLVQLPPGVLVTALAWTLLEERPPSPPSASAAQRWRDADAAASSAKGNDALATMVHDVRRLLANRNFACLAAGFAVGTGTVWALLILEAQLITPCGYSDALAGAAGAALLATGVAAAFALGAVMEATKAYLELQRSVMTAAVVATACVLAAARPDNAVLLLAAFCLLGSALQPLNPLTLEHAVEVTFPLSPEVSSSVLYMIANTFAFFLVLALTPLLALPASATCSTVFTPAAGTVLTCMAVGLAFTWAVQKDYRRSACEHREARADSPESPLLAHAHGGDAAYGTAAHGD